ncbi:hypothetical protein PhCBS80983_g02065 [Powellomyces hirtus]|uniref:IPT/TIG domain-containing protein n=1 Tax=Powellomyces hirtus TaxID=109895 RepID=A0A507E800_9FUNG|nr:hypothetical protein PhCBS80983_g02065 [Powellomyces hirtus]
MVIWDGRALWFFLLIFANTAWALCMNGSGNDKTLTLTEPYGYFWTHDSRTEYASDSQCYVLIAPQDGNRTVTSITIEFFHVETEDCCDDAKVYAGSERPTEPDTEFAKILGNNITDIVVPGDTALFHFQSDGTVNRDGIAGFYYITANATDIPRANLKCPFNCYGHGDCVNGRCQCHMGYNGGLCKNDDKYKVGTSLEGWRSTGTNILTRCFSFMMVVIVDLSENMLSGYIPEGLSELPEARILLHGNSFFCPTPNISQIISVSCGNVTVATIDPPRAVSGSTQLVTVTGDGFRENEGTTSCAFGGVLSTNTTVLNPNKVQCTVPQRVAGRTDFQLYAYGAAASANSVTFDFVPDCAPGTYLRSPAELQCSICPENAKCDGGSSPPYPVAGYHRALKDETVYLQCFIPHACPERKDGVCKEGFVGSRCSTCVPGAFLVNEECVTCSGVDTVKPLVLLVFATLALCVLGLWMALTVLNFSSTNILLLFVQVSGLILDVPLNWHSVFDGLGRSFAAVNVDLRQLGVACALSMDYEELVLFFLILPIVLLGIITTMVAFWVVWAVTRRKPKMEIPHALRVLTNVVTNAFIALLTLAHIPLAEKFVEVFQCATDVDRSYVISDTEVSCYTEEWLASRHKAIAGCIMYAAGIPLLVGIISWVNRNKLNDEQVVRRYGVLFDIYSDSAWWFEAYRCVYNLLLLLVPVALADYPLFIAAMGMVIYNVDGAIVRRYRPYRFPHANNIYPFVVWSWNLTNFTGILYSTRTLSATQSDIISSIASVVVTVTGLTLVHSLIYEWQLIHWISLRKLPYIGHFFVSKPWGLLFPVHLNKAGRAVARTIEKLPDTTESSPLNYYPSTLYEKVLPTTMKHNRSFPPPDTSHPELKEVKSTHSTGGQEVLKSCVMDGLHKRVGSVADCHGHGDDLEDGSGPS